MIKTSLAILPALACLFATPIEAAVTNWTVQSSASALTMSATVSSGGTFLTVFYDPQGPGSLVTSYGGTITTQQNFGSPGIPTDIQFLAASVVANNSGNWDPLPDGSAGTAAANYGLVFGEFLPMANAAVRDLEFNLSSGVHTLTSGLPSQSAHITLTRETVSGSIDARGVGVFSGLGTLFAELTGQSDSSLSAITIDYGSTVTTMEIPITMAFVLPITGADTTSTLDDSSFLLQLSGNLVATAPTATVPEANSLTLLGLAGSVVGFLGYRRTRKSLIEETTNA